MRTKSILVATSLSVALLTLISARGSAQAYEHRRHHETRAEHRGDHHYRFFWFFSHDRDHDRR
jgi:hypothetical protein